MGDEIKLDTFEGTVEEIQTRATVIKTYDERQVVIPNADLFTRSVIVNTAFHARRWEYDLTLKSVQDLAEIKSRVVRTVRAVPGVLSEPVPEALVVKLDSDTVTVRVLWWTNAPRQHQMLGSYDTVLTAISEALSHSGIKATFRLRELVVGLSLVNRSISSSIHHLCPLPLHHRLPKCRPLGEGHAFRTIF